MASQSAGIGEEAGSRRLPRSQGFAEEVMKVIRSDIMSLRIPPDTRISIDQLARELGVSQTPIREALSQLEAMGLVTKRHYVGYCSAPQLSRKQLDELYEARLLLEASIPLDCPVRLLHGQADADVPWSISLQLAECLRSDDVQVVLVKDGDHRLSRAADIALMLQTVDALCRNSIP